MGRTTREGIHYINDVPVKDSVFGKDPFEPVTCSFVPDIIHQQSNIRVEVIKEEDGDGNKALMEDGQGTDDGPLSRIAVYDARYRRA